MPDQGRGLLALVVSALSTAGRYSQRPADHRTLGASEHLALSLRSGGSLNSRGARKKP